MCPTHSVWGFVFSLGSDIPSSVQEVLPWYPVAVEDHEATYRQERNLQSARTQEIRYPSMQNELCYQSLSYS